MSLDFAGSRQILLTLTCLLHMRFTVIRLSEVTEVYNVNVVVVAVMSFISAPSK